MSQQIPPPSSWFPASTFLGGLLSWGSRQTPQTDAAASNASRAENSPPPPSSPESLRPNSAVVVGDTIFYDDDLVQEEPTSPAPSPLEQQAKLSWAAAGVDKVSRFFWYSASVPIRTLTWGLDLGLNFTVNRVVQLAAQKGVSVLGTQAPEGPLQTLRHCLHELHQKITDEIEIDDPLRHRATNAIAIFLANPKACLAECYDPKAIFFTEGLNAENKAKFQALLTALQERASLADDARPIKSLCDFIDKCCAFQLVSHEKKLGKQLIGRFIKPLPSITSAAGAAAKPTRTVSRTKRSVPSLPKPEPENPVPLILQEIEDLKSLGFRIALALLILPESSIHKKPEEESGGLAGLIKKSNVTLGDPNEIFQNLIYTEIDNSNLNYVQKKWKKFTCWVMAPAVLFIVDHVLDQSRDIALYLIGLSPEERLKMVVKMFIEPGLGFISWLQSEYKAISVHHNLGTTVDEAVSNAIDQIKIKDRHGKILTSTDLVSRLISSLIDKYAPALNWSNTATAHFEKRAEQSNSPFLALWFISWSYLTWTVSIISAPGRWLMNKIIRKVLKTVVVSKIQSKIKDNGESSWDFGKLALHSIYKTLYEKLQEKNRGEQESETENIRRKIALEQRGFVDKDVQDSINRLVSSFLKLLYIQGSDVIELSTKLSPNNVVEQGKITAMDLAFGPGIQKATEEIIHGLQIFLDDSTFSAGILEALKDIHQQSLRFNTGNTDTNLARLENDFYVELQDAVKQGIQEVIDDKLDPSKSIQNEADLFIDGLKYDTATFRDQFFTIQNLTPSSMKKLMRLRDKSLIDVFRRRCKSANDGTNPSTRQHIRSTREHFESLSKPICAKIDNLAELVEQRKHLEEVIENLAQLDSPLTTAITHGTIADATSFYKGLQLTLQMIKNKTYPKPVQDLISTLQGHFDSWRTEAAKKDNQTLLNGTIETLKLAVEDAIREQQLEIGRINGTIPQKPPEAGQQTPKTIAQESKELRKEITDLAEWTHRLNYFVCISENQQMDALKEVLSRFAEDGLSPLILKKLDDFFLFLGKNHNVKGMLSFIIKAYLERPNITPKEFKKILDRAKSNSRPPSPVPESPVI